MAFGVRGFANGIAKAGLATMTTGNILMLVEDSNKNVS